MRAREILSRDTVRKIQRCCAYAEVWTHGRGRIDRVHTRLRYRLYELLCWASGGHDPQDESSLTEHCVYCYVCYKDLPAPTPEEIQRATQEGWGRRAVLTPGG